MHIQNFHILFNNVQFKNENDVSKVNYLFLSSKLTAKTARKLYIKENTYKTMFKAYLDKTSSLEEQQESDLKKIKFNQISSNLIEKKF